MQSRCSSTPDVANVVAAIYGKAAPSGATHTLPGVGNVDFSQFKLRGHYTNSDELARYFRALMWMGRADTGFNLADQEAVRAALMLAVLARASAQLPAFAKVQDAIDFFVGSSNGLSLTTVAEIARKNEVTELAQLEDDARVAALSRELMRSAPQTRVTS